MNFGFIRQEAGLDMLVWWLHSVLAGHGYCEGEGDMVIDFLQNEETIARKHNNLCIKTEQGPNKNISTRKVGFAPSLVSRRIFLLNFLFHWEIWNESVENGICLG